MFPCGCSLRSTQCAALIALATAAGVMRMDTNRAAPNSVPASETAPAIVDARFGHRIAPSRYQVALQVLAPWLRVFGISIGQSNSGATTLVAAVGAGGAIADYGSLYFGATVAGMPAGAARSAEATQPDFFAWVAPAPTARHHAIPFAVGPPADKIASSNLRANGTAVPGDRIARWTSVASIASSPDSTFAAQPVRAPNPGQPLADSNFPLSSALRGEPAIASASVALRSLYPSARPYPALAIAGRSQSLHSLL